MNVLREALTRRIFHNLGGARGGAIAAPAPVVGEKPVELMFERRGDQWFEKRLITPEKKTMTDEAEPAPIHRRPEEYLAAHMLRAFHDDDYVEALAFAKLLAGAADELRDDLEGDRHRLRAALAQLANEKGNVETLQTLIAGLRTKNKEQEEQLSKEISNASYYKGQADAISKKFQDFTKRSAASRKGKKKRA